VKRLHSTRSGPAGDLPGRGGRQVPTLPRQLLVLLRERGLDEQHIRIPGQRDDSGTIRRSVGDIGDIRDPLSGRDRDEIAQIRQSYCVLN